MPTKTTNYLSGLLIAAVLVLTAFGVRADEEQQLIATLQSAAAAPEKCAACQRLRTLGTARSVPALAALLGQERTSQAARYALEGMPCKEAGAALRKALTKTSGLIQAGLADSVGWRGDTKAVPALKRLLRGTDVVVASAAASALGRIGNKKASAALASARDKVSPAVQPAVLDGMLQGAELRLAGGDAKGAASLYRELFAVRYPDRLRVAAWRGLVLADTTQRATLVSEALLGTDHALQVAALEVVRELGDAAVVAACVRQWAVLPANCQLAVLDAQMKAGGDVLPTVHLATRSPYPAVRSAAWLALSDLGDVSTIPTLARAAAGGEGAEREAAREALSRLRGPGVRDTLLKQITDTAPGEKAELLRALGERGDTEAANVLLDNAAAAGPARTAALDSLRKLAVPHTLLPLLNLAARSGSTGDSESALKALYAVCRASTDKDQTTRSIVEAMRPMSAAERREVLPVLAELGTPAALDAAQAAAHGQDSELAKEAMRVLGQWPNAAPAPVLLELARTSAAPSLRVLALRGCIEVAALDSDKTNRLQTLQQARSLATRPEEKKQALARIGQIPTSAALRVAAADLVDPDLANEAGTAAITIAEQVAASDAKLADETAARLIEQCKIPEITKRAFAIRVKTAGPGPFLQDWLVCGPYGQPGLDDLGAIFNLVAGPEKPGEAVQWTAVPRAEQVNLAALFPERQNCMAYLKTVVSAPDDSDALLLLGTDDGVKAWVNGVVVHTNNINRGAVPDQDIAPIRLKKGGNELMLKVTQGGGGWGAQARIVGTDARPIAGLRVEPGAVRPSAALPEVNAQR